MNTDDSGAGSLRAAIEQANIDAAQDTITFASSVTGTISLLTALPDLSNSMNIVGPGPSALTVASNRSSLYGIFTVLPGAKVAISGLTITGGLSPGGGSGIDNFGTLSIANDVISGNTAPAIELDYTGAGGGIYNSGTLSITDSTISGNTADAGSTFTRYAIPSQGGGIDNSGTMSVTDSTFSGNSASLGGGIENTGTATITCSTFYGNTAPEYGEFPGPPPPSPGQGGGIDNSGTLSVTYCTFSDNSSTLGGGIYNSLKTSIVDTIVAGNTASGRRRASDIGGDVTGSYNLIGAGGSGGLKNGRDGNIVLKSLNALGLSPLGNNRGPTQTMALLPNSPALDVGLAVSGVTTDQRGISRPAGSPPDIGAFEVAFSLNDENPTVTSVRHAGAQDSTSLALTFSEPMNATRADNLANYGLTWFGGENNNRAIPIRSARYSAATRTVTLRPIQRLPLSGTGTLTVVGTPPGGLTNTSGIFLDGADAGQPGSDYIAIINP
jgi:fibronectin-binding autotransporter adhesin